MNASTYGKTNTGGLVRVTAPIIRDEPLTAPATMIIGDVGAGKTHSIISAAKAGLEVFVLVTETQGVDSLIEAIKQEKVDINRVHWKRCTPARQSWDVIKQQARLSNNNSVGQLQELTNGLDRFRYPAFLDLISACQNFTCDRTKEEFGDVMSWDDSRLLCLDSLSGLGDIATTHVCGHRITMTRPEFNVVQNHIFILLNQLTSGNCHFMTTAHAEYETDEVKGVTKLMASTVGKKLAPKLPRIYSDVIFARKDKDEKFVWSNKETNVVTKTRYLKPGVHTADYKHILAGYLERKAQAVKEMTGTE